LLAPLLDRIDTLGAQPSSFSRELASPLQIDG
jgi:hypothetical protein